MDNLERDYEIVLADDGSTDTSLEILLKHIDKRIRIIELTKNYGQHAAIFAGFESCTGDIIITMDADLQNPPEEIPRLVKVMEEGNYEVVGTVRKQRKDSIFRKIPSKIINAATRRTTGVHLNDWGCMLRAYRRQVVDHMLATREQSTFIPALASAFLVTSFSDFPLKFMLYMGICLATSGITFGIILAVARLYFGAVWAAEGVFTLFAVLFFFVGAQFLAFGVIGEYVGRIYREVRKRPPYTVHRIHEF